MSIFTWSVSMLYRASTNSFLISLDTNICSEISAPCMHNVISSCESVAQCFQQRELSSLINTSDLKLRWIRLGLSQSLSCSFRDVWTSKHIHTIFLKEIMRKQLVCRLKHAQCVCYSPRTIGEVQWKSPEQILTDITVTFATIVHGESCLFDLLSYRSI